MVLTKLTLVQEYVLARDMWCSVTLDQDIKTQTNLVQRKVLANRVIELEARLDESNLPELKSLLEPYVVGLILARMRKATVLYEMATQKAAKKLKETFTEPERDLPWNM